MTSRSDPNHRFSLIKKRATDAVPTYLLEQEANALSICSSRQAREKLTYKDAVKIQALPLSLVERFNEICLVVAVSEEFSSDEANSLRFTVGCNIEIKKVKACALKRAIQRSYGGDDKEFEKEISCLDLVDKTLLPKIIHNETDFDDMAGVPRFLKTLVEYAISKSASDVHILPRYNGTFVMLRVNGELFHHDNPLCSLSLHEHLSRRIKILSKLDINEKRLPLDGNFTMNIAGEDINIRVSTIPTVHGEKLVLRIHNKKNIMEISQLGFNKKDLPYIYEALSSSGGLVLVCGSTGSGKTTTLYSFAKDLAVKNKNVVTVEDPVELTIQEISQTSIDNRANFDFPRAIKAVVRQDPDVILVGELRDPESLKICLQASMTGHLVLSSLHAGSIREAEERMLMLGAMERELKAAVNLIIVQRLEGVLCHSCKIIDLQETNRYKRNIYRRVGCNRCDYSGFIGRRLVAEIGQII